MLHLEHRKIGGGGPKFADLLKDNRAIGISISHRSLLGAMMALQELLGSS